MLWPNAKGSRPLSSAGEHVERSEPGEALAERDRLPLAAGTSTSSACCAGSEPSRATSSVTD